MDKGRFTPSVAKKLLRMLAGETVPSSSLPRWLAGELEGEGLLIPVTHGSRVSYRLTNVDVCRKFICDTYTSGTSLERWLEVADGEHATLERSMLVQETGNSKSIKLRTFCGFLVNSYEPIEAWMGDEAFLIAPSDGVAFSFSNRTCSAYRRMSWWSVLRMERTSAISVGKSTCLMGGKCCLYLAIPGRPICVIG